MIFATGFDTCSPTILISEESLSFDPHMAAYIYSCQN